MDLNQVTQLIGNVGFPVIVAWYLLNMAKDFLNKLTSAMEQQALAMEKLAESQMELRAAIQLLQVEVKK